MARSFPKCTLIFKIKNFSYLAREDVFIESPFYVVESVDSIQCFFSVEGSKRDGGFSCFLRRMEDNLHCDELFIDYSLELINGNAEILATFEEKNKPFGPSYYVGCEYLMAFDEIYNGIENWTHDTLTVQCTMSLATATKRPSAYVGLTEINVDQVTLNWTIDITRLNDNEFHLANYKFKLDLFYTDSVIKVCLINNEVRSTKDCFLSCKISAQNEKRISYALFQGKHSFRTNSIWKVNLPDCSSYLIDGNTLELICEFAIASGMQSNVPPVPVYKVSLADDSTTVLQDDLRVLYENKKHADVTLRAGNLDFPVHKSILIARSPVFSKMFDQDMVEKQSGVVAIADVEVKTLKSFLEFIYTGTLVSLSYDDAVSLLLAAEKYQVKSLTEQCVSFLLTVLSGKNVCKLLHIADMVSHERLKTAAMAYIAKHTDDILTSPEWPKWSMSNLLLTSEILIYIASNCKITLKNPLFRIF